MNWIVAAIAVVVAADLPQRVHLLRRYTEVQRVTVGVGLVVAAVGVAAIASPLLDALDVSSPTLEVGAGMVLVLWSVVAFFAWADEPAVPPVAAGLVPGLFPVVFTPPLGVVLWCAGARNGFPVTIAGAVIVGAVLAAGGADRVIGRRAARRLSATAGVIVGIVLMTDGVLAV